MQIPDEEGIVIDGFPRDVAQALSFEDQVRMSPYILNDLLFAENFEIKKRFLGRLALILNEFWSENGQVHQYGLAEGHFLGTHA